MDITDNPKVGNRENGSIGVLVDGDDGSGVLHADKVLHGARDTDSDVDVGLDRLARLPHLLRIRDPAGVDDGPCGPGCGSQRLGESLDQIVRLGRTKTASPGYNDGGVT